MVLDLVDGRVVVQRHALKATHCLILVVVANLAMLVVRRRVVHFDGDVLAEGRPFAFLVSVHRVRGVLVGIAAVVDHGMLAVVSLFLLDAQSASACRGTLIAQKHLSREKAKSCAFATLTGDDDLDLEAAA